MNKQTVNLPFWNTIISLEQYFSYVRSLVDAKAFFILWDVNASVGQIWTPYFA